MKVLASIAKIAFTLFALTAFAFYGYPKLLVLFAPCRQPIAYDIGTVDDRFSLNRNQFLDTLLQAETVWETPMGREFFRYEPGAAFKINLVYDYRQETTDRQEQLNAAIEADLTSYKQMKDRYTTLSTNYETRLAAYEAEVKSWNQKGGAPEAEYKRLETERVSLNALADQLTALAKKLNSLSASTNEKVEEYNSSAGRVFDKGVYTTNGRQEAITIYEYKTTPELTLALAHELGHALGIEHVENNKSVMYYLLQDQDTKQITLTTEDRDALTTVCKL